MKITFYGAAGMVTGSKHVVEVNHRKILLDCGLFQGPKSLVGNLNSVLPFEAADIDNAILSHAHADHCGMLPVLVKNGFHGKIFATPGTIDLAKFILEDSAKIQEQDAIYINDHQGVGENPVAPLYTIEDVERTSHFFEEVKYERTIKSWTTIEKNVNLKLYDAGHILGSAMVVLSLKEGSQIHNLAFTGDLGPAKSPLLHSPETFEELVETMLLECTYGSSNHEPVELAESKLEELIKAAYASDGKIIIPAFSLGRTQEIVYLLHRLTDTGRIPRIPVIIDSPLATRMSTIFAKYPEYYDKETWADFPGPNETPLHFRNLIYTQTVEESKALNTRPGPFIIISASGMLEGGRVLHHIKHNIQDPNSVILLTGYQAPETLGRTLEDGVQNITIHGIPLRVLAKVEMLKELSAHADKDMLLNFVKNVRGLKNLFLVHTEVPKAEVFKALVEAELPEIKVHIPRLGEVYEL
jgi:metallo-beta-lactamase family protein